MTNNSLIRLRSAVQEWDRLKRAKAVMEEDKITFGTVLDRRARTMERIIEAARTVSASEPETPK